MGDEKKEIVVLEEEEKKEKPVEGKEKSNSLSINVVEKVGQSEKIGG
jgi:hypothetical protein